MRARAQEPRADARRRDARGSRDDVRRRGRHDRRGHDASARRRCSKAARRSARGAACAPACGSPNATLGDDVTVLDHSIIVALDGRRRRARSVRSRTSGRESVVGDDAHVGNFVELKKTTLGRGSKANHLAYLGDATIGDGRQHRRRHDHVQLRRREASIRRSSRTASSSAATRSSSRRCASARARTSPRDRRSPRTCRRRARDRPRAAGEQARLGAPSGARGSSHRRIGADRCAASSATSGPKPLLPVIIDGLRRLEYRGYDSAGVAVVRNGADRSAAQRRQALASRGRARQAAARRRLRHRPHALGDARPADRGERASASRLHRHDRRRPQRHHRELPRAEARADRRGPQVRHRDRHGGRRAPGREGDGAATGSPRRCAGRSRSCAGSSRSC